MTTPWSAINALMTGEPSVTRSGFVWSTSVGLQIHNPGCTHHLTPPVQTRSHLEMPGTRRRGERLGATSTKFDISPDDVCQSPPDAIGRLSGSDGECKACWSRSYPALHSPPSACTHSTASGNAGTRLLGREARPAFCSHATVRLAAICSDQASTQPSLTYLADPSTSK